jgi:hypothetical protein
MSAAPPIAKNANAIQSNAPVWPCANPPATPKPIMAPPHTTIEITTARPWR